MPWLLPALAVAQMLGVIFADRSWLSVDGARALGAVALAAGVLVIRRPRWLVVAAAWVAIAAGALAMATRLEQAAHGRPVAATEHTIEGTIHATTRTEGGYRIDLVEVKGVGAAAAAVPTRIRLYASATPPSMPAIEQRLPGERIRARVGLHAPRSLRNPGARSPIDDLRRAGIGAQGRLTHPSLHVRLPQYEALRPLAWLHARRVEWGRRIAAAGPGSGLLRALALGDRGGLSPDSRETFARLGIAHLLAVSGLHLALVASLAFALARAGFGCFAALAARWDTRLLALACSVATACGYAVLCGFGVPVRRALILLCGLGLAFQGGRPRAALPLLAAAIMAVLAADPADLFRPGAQLSFAASLALLAAARREVPAVVERGVGPRILRAALRTTASAVAVTAPLAAWHLGRAAPFALGINLVAIPWTALVVLPAAGVSLLAAVLPDGDVTDCVLVAMAAVAHATESAMQALATQLPTPPAVARFAGPVWGVLGALAFASLAATRTRSRVLLAVAITAVVAVAPPVDVLPAAPRMVVLEVGQGDATLIQTPTAAVLIDAGTALPDGGDRGAQVVVPALTALGIRTLDLLVVTHADLDHRGGVPAVLRAVPVTELWLPYGAAAESGFEAIRAAARARDVPVRECGADSEALEIGDLRATPLWPPRGHGGSRNDRSLVVRIDVSGQRLLLPGDIEAAAEAALIGRSAALKADVLVLPHHGSRTSSSAAFLEAVDPEIAIVSAPCEGRFGMPHAPVLQRAQERSLTLWWTGRDGAVMIGLAGPLTATGSADPAASPIGACDRPIAGASFRYDEPENRGVMTATRGVGAR